MGKQIPRHQKIEQVPKFTESVLNGGAGEHEPLFAVHLLHRLRDESGLILNILGFVQNAAVEFPLLILLNILTQQLIGRDTHIRLAALCDALTALSGSTQYEGH